MNPCARQAAIVAEHKNELDFYRLVTGADYPGEYGERLSARRRGSKFEENLCQNNAALLRRALAPLFGYDSEAMYVRNFAEEVPGPPTTMRAVRLSRMRDILRRLSRGEDVPHLLIQPQLQLFVGPDPNDAEYISPDAMVLDSRTRMYRPVEEKSFIVRDGVADGADLNLSRRQAAAQIAALRDEAGRVGLAGRVDDDALFVFATPWGLSPATPVAEALEQELFELARAIATIREVRVELVRLRAGTDVPLEDLIDDLPFTFREGCPAMCLLADRCKTTHLGTASVLGDAISELVGPSMRIARLVELMRGATPRDDEERALAIRLSDAADVLGLNLRSA
jgi:hypothetical protein